MDYRKTVEHLREKAEIFKKSNYAVDGVVKCFEESADTIERLAEELDKYKLALFGIIRNSKVMPVGLAQGRSMEEINAMSLKTMEEVLKMCDFDKMKQFYSEAEEALAKMKKED